MSVSSHRRISVKFSFLLQFSPVPNLEIKNDETPTKSSHHVVIDWRWSHIHWMSLILDLVGSCVECWHHLVEFSKVWKQFANTHHHLSILVSQFSTYCGALSYPSGWGFPVKLGVPSSSMWAEGFPVKLEVGSSNLNWTTSLQSLSCELPLWLGVILWPEVTKTKTYSLKYHVNIIVFWVFFSSFCCPQGKYHFYFFSFFLFPCTEGQYPFVLSFLFFSFSPPRSLSPR